MSYMSVTYFKMFGGHCRRVMLITPTTADEYPYELAKMKPCDKKHKHGRMGDTLGAFILSYLQEDKNE